MKHPPPKRPPILARRTAKRKAEAAEQARTEAVERGKAQRARQRGHVLVNPENLARNNSYGTPDFLARGYYVDRPFDCKTCGVAQVWTETQQKWWYESAKGDVWAVAVSCRPCRRKEQACRAAAREVHLAGIAGRRKNGD